MMTRASFAIVLAVILLAPLYSFAGKTSAPRPSKSAAREPAREPAHVIELRKAADAGDLDAVRRLRKIGVAYRKPWSPLRLSAWPQPDFASSFPAPPYVRGISLGLSVAHEAEMFGIQVAPLPMVTRGAGVQLGGSVHAGRFYGVQIGILSASDERFGGVQISALNNTDGMSKRSCGVQVGVINGGSEVRGVQVGVGNGGKNMRGLQIGAYNQSGQMRPGFQIGTINRTLSRSSKSHGFQIGGVNLVRAPFSGLQVGLYNTCASLSGVQIGVLNRVADRRFLGGYFPFLNIGW